jgi:hypothetical protein
VKAVPNRGAVSVQITVDAAGPGALADFWAAALHYRVDDPPPGYESWQDALEASGLPPERWDDASAIVPVTGDGPRIYFQKVPEAKLAKNRLHFDVGVGRGIADPEERWRAVEVHVDRLVGLGATVVEERRNDWGDHWMVLQDPEGNEFCVQ